MRIHLGCVLIYECSAPTPMIVMLTVHHSRVAHLEYPDHLRTVPPVPIESYRDVFGNWVCRLVAPAGRITLSTDTVIRDDGLVDPTDPHAVQHPVEQLPSETLQFLLGSRYCETDKLSDTAWRLFEHAPTGWGRVQAICDFVHQHIRFDYMQARATRTAAEAYMERTGVCRDYAHLAVAFCRCMNIPARYCTGYISDIGTPPPYSVMDFAAWIEVYLGGRWHVFDPRNNTRRIGRILIATGRDAADVPLTHTFGQNMLVGFKVLTDEIPDAAIGVSG
jgi:transglutaminase-like putative cysteine protease